jgi:ectoine hydroxylase-related dioxygenase (phytanoyl-CoA dioxygenase family)
MLQTIQRYFPRCVPKHKPELDINRIRISELERSSARLSRQTVQRSVEEFHRNGLVVLENAIGHNAIDHVYQRMLEDFHKQRESKTVHWNQGRGSGNISQTPPLLREYLHEEIWANRLGVSIMEHILGPKPQLSFATSNIALPRTSGRHAVHSDYYCSHYNFPVFLEVNVYLHDVDAGNGATEFWLGTHEGYSKRDHSSATTGWIKQEVFTPRAAISPPIQPAISKGSLMIRDLRCWHAGRENPASEPRIILGFMFSPQWFGSHMRLKFPSEARTKVGEWSHVECADKADFVEGDFDYLSFHQDINLSQTPFDPDVPYVPKHGAGVVTPKDYWVSS